MVPWLRQPLHCVWQLAACLLTFRQNAIIKTGLMVCGHLPGVHPAQTHGRVADDYAADSTV